ncbi:MAG: hypothetical protein QXD89_00710 [Candidatus Aenigmatarchaeota archaeon]
MRGKLLLLSVIVLLTFFIIPFIFRSVVGVDIFSTGLSFFVVVLIAGVFLGISAFLPYKWGKSLREISYVGLFIAFLIFFFGAIKPFIKERTELELEDCVNVFFPKSTRDNIIYNALTYTSCILTGKFPAEQGDIGWAVFFIFYIVLPFVFIFTLIYGLMQGMELSSLFGDSGATQSIITLLSFVISMYAARTMMGVFILQFIGYGAWGLAAVFGSIFLVLGLKKLVDGWFKIEEQGQETRRMIENQMKFEAQFAYAVRPIIEKALALGKNNETLPIAKTVLASIKDNPMFSTLSEEGRKAINWYIERANSSTSPKEFRRVVEELKRFLKLEEKTK